MKLYSVPNENIYEGTRPGGIPVVLFHEYTALERRVRDLEASYRHSFCESRTEPPGCAVCGFAADDPLHVTANDGVDACTTKKQ